eukprot:IDg1579t1
MRGARKTLIHLAGNSASGMCSTGKLEFSQSNSPTLGLVNNVTGNVKVESCRRKHVQDVLAVGEQGEITAGCKDMGRRVTIATI